MGGEEGREGREEGREGGGGGREVNCLSVQLVTRRRIRTHVVVVGVSERVCFLSLFCLVHNSLYSYCPLTYVVNIIRPNITSLHCLIQ